MKFSCVRCGAVQRVRTTRKHGERIWRYYKCNCGETFKTVELREGALRKLIDSARAHSSGAAAQAYDRGLEYAMRKIQEAER